LRRRRLLSFEHVPFVILYAFALYQCYETFGEPYRVRIHVLACVSSMFIMISVCLSYSPPFPTACGGEGGRRKWAGELLVFWLAFKFFPRRCPKRGGLGRKLFFC
jgi:hypothetical protein